MREISVASRPVPIMSMVPSSSYMSLPPAPAGFEWIEATWGAGLRSVALAAIAPHVFTTRQLPLTSPVDSARLAAAVDASRVVMATQVHGRDVIVIREGDALPLAMPPGDVFVSNALHTAV